jgi:hypothetical protein
MDGSSGGKAKQGESFQHARPYESPWILMNSPELVPIREDLIHASRDGTVVARGRFCQDSDSEPGELKTVPQDAWRSSVDWDRGFISLDGPGEHYWEDISWRRADLESLFLASGSPKDAHGAPIRRGRPPTYEEAIWAAAVFVADEHGLDEDRGAFIRKVEAQLAEMGVLPDPSTVRRSRAVKVIFEQVAKRKQG